MAASPYDLLPAEQRAAIEMDARPKDGSDYLTALSRMRVAQLRRKYIDKAKKPKDDKPDNRSLDEILADEAKSLILADAYRAKVAAECFAATGNTAAAAELTAQEEALLKKAGVP